MVGPAPFFLLESLRLQLAQHQTNLNKLREEVAVYAVRERPLHLMNKIEAEEEVIAELEVEIGDD